MPPSPDRRRRAVVLLGLAAVVLLVATVAYGTSLAAPTRSTPAPHSTASEGTAIAAMSLDPSPSPTPASPSPPPSPSASPSAGPTPSPANTATPVAAASGFRMDVYRASAFATQANIHYCVPGASLIMVNLVTGHGDRTSATQDAMYAYGQGLGLYPNEGAGVDPAGWAGILTHFGAGAYAWHSYPTVVEALRHAALRIRQTGRPVGLQVGMHVEHAWVMTGFTATADPAAGPFTLTSVAITGPLWPTQRYYLGYYDMPPDTWLTVDRIAPAIKTYTATFPTMWDGMYVTVEP